MLGGLVRLFLYRFLGARIMLALAVFGWIRKILGGRREAGRRDDAAIRGRTTGRKESAYQPSQGASQIEQRDPR